MAAHLGSSWVAAAQLFGFGGAVVVALALAPGSSQPGPPSVKGAVKKLYDAPPRVVRPERGKGGFIFLR